MGKASLYQFGRKGNVERFIAEQPNPAKARRDLERFFDQAQEIHGVCVNQEFLVTPTHVMRTEDVIWVYFAKVKETFMGVLPYPSSYHIWIYTTEDKQYNVLSAKEKGRELMTYLFDKMPAAYFCGYSEKPDVEQLRERWKAEKDYCWFRTQAVQQHKKR